MTWHHRQQKHGAIHNIGDNLVSKKHCCEINVAILRLMTNMGKAAAVAAMQQQCSRCAAAGHQRKGAMLDSQARAGV
jgi:hypothetical protein